MFLLLALRGKAGHFFMADVLPYRNISIWDENDPFPLSFPACSNPWVGAKMVAAACSPQAADINYRWNQKKIYLLSFFLQLISAKWQKDKCYGSQFFIWCTGKLLLFAKHSPYTKALSALVSNPGFKDWQCGWHSGSPLKITSSTEDKGPGFGPWLLRVTHLIVNTTEIMCC